MKGNKQIELKAQRYLYERVHLSGSCVVTTFDPFDLEQAFIDGANWRYEQFEKNRLAACDNMTKEEAKREQEFVTYFLEKNLYAPTYSDAIEYGRKQMIDKACEYINNHWDKLLVYEYNQFGGSVFNRKKTVEQFRKAMEE